MGGAGPNNLSATNFGGAVTLRGMDGNDTLTGGPLSDSLDGGNDTDQATYYAGNNNDVGAVWNYHPDQYDIIL